MLADLLHPDVINDIILLFTAGVLGGLGLGGIMFCVGSVIRAARATMDM